MLFPDQVLRKNETPKETPENEAAACLQKEISLLEAELERIKKESGAFEIQIYTRLDREIRQIRELSELYKNQKKEKKAKRLAQKKKGKNYQEPKPMKLNSQQREADTEITISPSEQTTLKRLYKEAVLLVHPDKFYGGGTEDQVQNATFLTARLNGIYKRGDLDELMNFYHFLISENTLLAKDSFPEEILDSKMILRSLKKKKEALSKQLDQLKSSYIYQVLTTYEHPLSFIDELHLQFQERILQLEKRTRVKKVKVV